MTAESKMDVSGGPVTSLLRRRRLRAVSQTEMAECGLASLAMVADYWGKNVGLTELRRRFPVTSRGTSLSDLIRIASELQLSSRPLKIGTSRLKDLSYPAILHWDLNHFVVGERFKRGRVYVVDPAHGSGGWHDTESLDRRFSGVALELEPSADFEPESKKRELGMRELWGQTHGFTSMILQALLLSMILQLFVLASPYFLQVAVDEAIPAGDKALLTALLIGFGGFALITGIAHAMRGFVLLAAGTTLAYAMATNVARHMLRLPISWFEKRSVGDILSRYQSIQPLRLLMTEGMAAALLDGLMAILTLLAMAIYSPILTTIPLLSLALYILLRVLTLPEERATEGESIIAQGREQGAMIEILRGMTTIRLGGRESLRQAVWQNKLTDFLSERYAHDKVGAIQKAGGHLLEGLEMVLVIGIAAMFIIDGVMSIGMLFAFAVWRQQFSLAARSVVDHAVDWRKARLHLERLSDITFSPEDPGFAEPETSVDPICGDLELRGVSYRYGDFEPLVLRNIDLRIEAGENVVITGPSGSGKSTLLNILLGLVDPTSGEVLVDGMLLARYGRRAYRAQLGAVLQEDTLFVGSIAENVSGFLGHDPTLVRSALKQAAVWDDIERMAMKENTLVGDMGSAISGGQKQRILIARALYAKPRLLCLDEGTSHLDTEHERQVNTAIGHLRITRIAIAHRRETIDAADRVIRLVNGQIESDERK